MALTPAMKLRRRKWLQRALGRVGSAIPTTADIVAMLTGSGALMWDTTDKANLFQSLDTSSPVTASGQAVRRMTELIGGGAFTQSTDSRRPVYSEADGFGALLCDGTDDRLVVTSGYMLSVLRNRAYGVFIGAAKPGTTAFESAIFHVSINGASTETRLTISKGSTDKLRIDARQNDAVFQANRLSTAGIAGAWGVFRCDARWTERTMATKINNAATESGIVSGWTAGVSTDDTDSSAVTIGGRGTSTNQPFSGPIGPGVFMPFDPSANLAAAITLWAASKTGVSL